MKFLKFLISKAFLINFVIAIAVFILVLLATLYSLDYYTHHGEEMSVPDLSGMTIEEVDQVLKESKLRYEIIDSVYLPEIERGTVVEQVPAVNFKVKEKRRIFLTINSFTPEKIVMPNLTGVTLRQAQSLADAHGLKVGNLEYVPDISTTILRQNYKGEKIEEGELITKGVYIDLVIGQGLSNKKAYIPDLIALVIQNAEIKLTEASLNLGAIITDETIETPEDSLNAKIWKQAPISDTESEIYLGAYIDIWLSLDSTLLPVKDSLIIDLENEIKQLEQLEDE